MSLDVTSLDSRPRKRHGVASEKSDIKGIDYITDRRDAIAELRVNVGGVEFRTTYTTLSREPCWVLAAPSLSHFDLSGSLFFDADPDVFKWILQRLRSGCELPCPPDLDPRLVRTQLEFWGLQAWWPDRPSPRYPVDFPVDELSRHLDLATDFFCEGHTVAFTPSEDIPDGDEHSIRTMLARSYKDLDLTLCTGIGIGIWCEDITLEKLWELNDYTLSGGSEESDDKSLYDYLVEFKCTTAASLVKSPEAAKVKHLIGLVSIWVDAFPSFKERARKCHRGAISASMLLRSNLQYRKSLDMRLSARGMRLRVGSLKSCPTYLEVAPSMELDDPLHTYFTYAITIPCDSREKFRLRQIQACPLGQYVAEDEM